MNHLDEGTIHAWLDGALDAAQSADVEAHVAACSSCAALVAEARGFIAASSRILGALDDDRVNVIPASPAAVVPLAPVRRVRRTAPWLMAVAAVLVAAVVLRTTGASRDRVMSEAPTLTSPLATTGMDSTRPAPPAAPPAASAPAGQPSRPSTPRLEGRGATGTDISAAAVAANTPAPAEQTRMRAMAQSVPAPARAEVGGVAGGTSVTSAVDAPVAAAKSAQREEAALVLTDQTVAGCYPMPPASGFNAPAPTVASGAASRANDRRAATRAAAPQAAPSAMAAADFASVTRVVRLDSASSDVARAVRVVPSDSVVGTWRVVGDSIRVELGAGRSFNVARTARTACP